MSNPIKKQVLERDRFICQKCGYRGISSELQIHQIKTPIFPNKLSNFFTLCQVCKQFAPTTQEEMKKYLLEKIDWKILETFREFQSKFNKIKSSMNETAKKGNPVTRAPFGYDIEDKKLVPNSNALIVMDIYTEFLKPESSLNKLSRKYNLSVNGIKKILTNFTYLGKIKFLGEISQGIHKPLVSSELFNQVQKKIKGISK